MKKHSLPFSSSPLRRPMRTARAFTLIEMIVAVALFSVVMLVCVAALLALVGANRKAQALEAVTSNLDMALDGMARSIRMGNTYYCGQVSVPAASLSSTRDCATGGSDGAFAFEPYGNGPGDKPWVYYLQNNRIYRAKENQPGQPITAPEVTITDLRFYVVGTTQGDTIQPKVVIVVKGTAPVQNSQASTSFHIQITVVQRLLDL